MDITTIGLDLAKSIFQVHGVDANGRVVIRKSLRRAQISFADSIRASSLN
jgi:transposase